MNLTYDISIICGVLQLSEAELAKKLGVSIETIDNWKKGINEPSAANLEKFYSFVYSRKINLNNVYEQLFKEEKETDGHVVLFHGAKKDFSLPINFLSNSKATNDFGVGFYLGETFEQASNYISVLNRNFVYCFCLNTKKLKIYKFGVDTEWMIAIAYHRGWLENYKNSPLVEKIVGKLPSYDIIIAPIADNRMFDIIAEFVEGEITDEQCKHALSATNLGFQYVLKTSKALEGIELLREMYVCEKEKSMCLENRRLLAENGSKKVKIARIKYKNQGHYIEEILK